MGAFDDFISDKPATSKGGGFDAFLAGSSPSAPKAGISMMASHTPGEVPQENTWKKAGRQVLTGVGAGLGGVAAGLAATPETLGAGTIPAAVGGAMLGGSAGKALGNVVFGPGGVPEMPTPPQGKTGMQSLGIGLKRLPETLPKSVGNLVTMPYDVGKTIIDPALQGDIGDAMSATGEAIKGVAKFPYQATGLSDVVRNKRAGIPAFADMSNFQSMSENDLAGTAAGVLIAGQGIKGVAKGAGAVRQAVKNMPSHYEREAGKFFLEGMPEEGSYLGKEAAANTAKAAGLQADTGAKLSLEQQTGLNTQIAGKKALESRDPHTQSKSQEWREENLKLVQKMIKDVGGNEGEIDDVRQALKDALSVRQDQVRMAEQQLSEAERGLSMGVNARKAVLQNNVEDLYNKQTHLEDALQRAEEEYKAQQGQRQQLLDRAKGIGDEKGKEMLAGAANKGEIGAQGRQQARASMHGMKQQADEKYDAVRQYSGVEIPDVSPLENIVRQIANEHPVDFRFLRDKADNVTRDILKRIAPEEGEQEYSDILDSTGTPMPKDVETPPPLTIGELDLLSKGIGKMRREASANSQTLNLARRLGDIKDGINKSLETVADEGLKGKFNEVNTMDAGEWSDLAEGMRKNQFFSRNKNGKKFSTTSDFTTYVKENFPSVTMYPKDVILGAVDKAGRGDFGKMTDAERQIIDDINRDMTQKGAQSKGVSLDKSPLELIQEANRYYRDEFVPQWRDPASPGVKALAPNWAGMEKVKDAEVLAQFMPAGDKGIYAGEMYRKVYGDNIEPAHDYAVRDLLDNSFDENKGEWSSSSARGWLRKKSYALKEIGIYDDMAEIVNSIPDMTEMKKELGEPSPAAKEAAERDLRNFKARIGNVMTATGKLDESALPEYGMVEDAKRVLRARQESLKALEKSPVGDMVTGDWEKTVDNFVAAARGNYTDSVKLVMNTLKDKPEAQAAFKSAFSEYLYSRWKADAQKTMDLEASPTPAKANRVLQEFAPAIKELYGEEGYKAISQAKEIIDSMARSQKNTVSGSETRLFGNSGRYRNMNRAISMLAVMHIPGTNWAVGTWVGSKITAVMQTKFDSVLRRAYFDPEYAGKLVDIAKRSDTSSMKMTIRRLGNLVKDERGIVGMDIGKANEDNRLHGNSGYAEGGMVDYDMAGYQQKYGQPVMRTPGQHYSDEFKYPNHPTFSDQSKYSTPEQQGGKWAQIPGSAQWNFYASPFNVQQHGAEGLQQYFQKNEPGNVLHLPNSQGGYSEGGQVAGLQGETTRMPQEGQTEGGPAPTLLPAVRFRDKIHTGTLDNHHEDILVANKIGRKQKHVEGFHTPEGFKDRKGMSAYMKAQGYDNVPDEMHSQDLRKLLQERPKSAESEVSPKIQRREARKKARSVKDEA